MANAGLRAAKLWSPRVMSETRRDGSILVWQADPLGPYPDRITDRLIHWATVAADRPWLAQRRPAGGWRTVSYGEGLGAVRRLGQALLDRGLSPERPVMILSENGIEHALLAVAAQHVGIPSAAISPAYSLISSDFARLRDIAAQLSPGIVFAADGTLYARAIAAAIDGDVPVVATENPPADRRTNRFAELAQTPATDDVDRAHAAVGPDTVAKFLFTSGTTGSPKAVIQSQRMLCSNQEMVASCYAFMREEPPVVVDWAPWHHTASGNKVFNMVLYNGGTFYIDEGKPSQAGIEATIRNLREVSPTWYFNVPAGYEALVAAMEQDSALRRSFFRNLRMMMYAGAGMAQHTWDRLSALAVQTLGERVLLAAGLGSTETGPFALMCTEEQERPGNIGIPAHGVTLKLVPAGDKLEARLKGPMITPGYWRNPELTAGVFDTEGFYRLGDALRFAEPGNPARGFFFDGRLAENFKLRTGSFVAVGAVRAGLVNAFGGLVRDAVITGENRDELGALLLPAMPALRSLVPDGPALADAAVLVHPAVRERLAALLDEQARAASGSANRVVRALPLAEPPSLDKGEVTDKGSINHRAVLRHRAVLVEALYDDGDPRVIRVGTRDVAT
jgi:feruloyl-CoA synthase